MGDYRRARGSISDSRFLAGICRALKDAFQKIDSGDRISHKKILLHLIATRVGMTE